MPAFRLNGFVQLDRCFREISIAGKDDDRQTIDLSGAGGKAVTWDELLQLPRVVVLSEAGAGKTVEIRAAARRLEREGKSAFFLRLENVVDGFKGAFEIGSIETFQAWMRSDDKGWLFLDSVDESRLKSSRDFEKAINLVKDMLEDAGSRVHLLLTSRVSAWRPVSDRQLCEDFFPVNPGSQRGIMEDNGGTERTLESSGKVENFKFYTLEDLNPEQVRKFSQAKEVEDLEAFLKEIQDSGMSEMVARPDDLGVLIEMWRSQHRLGSRVEVMRTSVDLRLSERDLNRRDLETLVPLRAQEASKLIAAAATLTRNQEILLPDAEVNTEGLSLDPLLLKWRERDRKELLQRPIFDEGNYGRVRFHHRSTREFLTAEWFLELMRRGGSPRKVDSCFFREVNGESIVTPVLRPILPWLSLWEEPIRRHVVECAPEILLEGGDPASLPLESRIAALSNLCEKMDRGELAPWFRDYDRMAGFSKGLAKAIQSMFQQFGQNDSVVAFLLRLIEKGRLSESWWIVESVVHSPAHGIEVRKLAIYAANAIGSTEQLRELRSWYASSEFEDRQLLAIFIEVLPSDRDSIQWLLTELKRSSSAKAHAFDVLEYQLPKYVNGVAEMNLPALVDGFESLLGSPPWKLDISARTSLKYEWLMKSASQAVLRLLESHNPASLGPSVLATLFRIEDFHYTHDHEVNAFQSKLKPLVQGWKELNQAVFWNSVQRKREGMKGQGEGTLDSYLQVLPKVLWDFRPEDFDVVLRCIRERTARDDQRVACSLALSLYHQAERPSDWLAKIRDTISGDLELNQLLEQFLSPQVEPELEKRLRVMQEKQRRDEEKRKQEESKRIEEGREHFRKHLARLKRQTTENPELLPSEVINLFRECQSKEFHSSRWSVSNWRYLESVFGIDVALFFRDTAVAYWKRHTPQTRSEGAAQDKVTYGVLVGLAGLAIETRENPSWLDSLTPIEVDRACRFASFEMNGFPNWFSTLFDRFPNEVGAFLLNEIRFEMDAETSEKRHFHIIQHLEGSANWAHEWLAPHLLDVLAKTEPKNPVTLDALLRMVRSSSVEDLAVSRLAAKKCQIQSLPTEHRATWLAAWIGVAPNDGIPELETELENFSEGLEQKTFAQMFITRLVGGRWRNLDSIVARTAFQEPGSLKVLYDLMHRFIRVEEDIDRSKEGVYSPELQDYAQEARDALLFLLEQIPGEDAYRALREIAEDSPPGHARSWILQRAKVKAEQEGDLKPWSPEAVREFQESLLRTPRNLHDLSEFARLKIMELKDSLENGDYSIAGLLLPLTVQETEVRNAIGDKLRDWAQGRYQIEQESELADGKRPDLRFIGNEFDGRVPVELKLAERWNGAQLKERLENQLGGDYLRDERSGSGIFLLVNRIRDKKWNFDGENVDFPRLVESLQNHWGEMQSRFPHVKKVDVIGIDLTKRDRKAHTPANLVFRVPAQALSNRLARLQPGPIQVCASPHTGMNWREVGKSMK